MGFGVWGLGFGVWGLGLGAWGLGLGVWGLGFGVWGFGVWPEPKLKTLKKTQLGPCMYNALSGFPQTLSPRTKIRGLGVRV